MVEAGPVFHYRAAGFRVDSTFAFPQATPIEPTDAWEADVTFERGPFSSSDVGLRSGNARTGCTILNARSVVVTAQDLGAGKMLSVGLNGVAYYRGRLPLHAGAVLAPAGCIALCGEKGAGKSTLTSALALRGCGVVTDDLLVVDEENGVLSAWPTVARPQILHRSLDMFDAGITWDPQIAKDGKVIASIGAAAPYAPYPLAAIYHLSWGDAEVRRLTQLEAAAAMASFLRKPEWCEPSGAASMVRRRWLDLAARIPIVKIIRPHGVDLSSVVDLILNNVELHARHGECA